MPRRRRNPRLKSRQPRTRPDRGLATFIASVPRVDRFGPYPRPIPWSIWTVIPRRPVTTRPTLAGHVRMSPSRGMTLRGSVAVIPRKNGAAWPNGWRLCWGCCISFWSASIYSARPFRSWVDVRPVVCSDKTYVTGRCIACCVYSLCPHTPMFHSIQSNTDESLGIRRHWHSGDCLPAVLGNNNGHYREPRVGWAGRGPSHLHGICTLSCDQPVSFLRAYVCLSDTFLPF